MAENSKIEWTKVNPYATGRQLGAYKSAAKKLGLTLTEWITKRASGARHCFRCKEWKPATEFATDRTRLGGVTAQCKPCLSTASSAARYGLTHQELIDLRQRSGGICAICEQERVLVIDHRHTCGTVRGLLCDTCNRGLGMFGDSPDRLRRAAFYLEQSYG